MNYDRKELVDWVRGVYQNLDDADKQDALRFFPELRESNDERIRKYLIEELKAAKSVGELKFIIPQPTREECIAYLEKQKEQKPNYCHHEVDETGWTEEYRKAYYDGWNNCNMQHEQLKADHKPAEWSEEDERILKGIIGKIDHDQTYGVSKDEMLNYLKKL